MQTLIHLRVLHEAALGALPARIDSDAAVSRAAVADLVASGHLSAVEAASGAGLVLLDVKITDAGRRRLRELWRAHPEATPPLRQRTRRTVARLLVYLAYMLVLSGLFLAALRQIAERVG